METGCVFCPDRKAASPGSVPAGSSSGPGSLGSIRKNKGKSEFVKAVRQRESRRSPGIATFSARGGDVKRLASLGFRSPPAAGYFKVASTWALIQA